MYPCMIFSNAIFSSPTCYHPLLRLYLCTTWLHVWLYDPLLLTQPLPLTFISCVLNVWMVILPLFTLFCSPFIYLSFSLFKSRWFQLETLSSHSISPVICFYNGPDKLGQIILAEIVHYESLTDTQFRLASLCVPLQTVDTQFRLASLCHYITDSGKRLIS